jgi:Na+/phosphate symporter
MKTVYAFTLGFLFTGIIYSAIGLVLSLVAWQSKGMVEWGLVVIALGAIFKTVFDRL